MSLGDAVTEVFKYFLYPGLCAHQVAQSPNPVQHGGMVAAPDLFPDFPEVKNAVFFKQGVAHVPALA